MHYYIFLNLLFHPHGVNTRQNYPQGWAHIWLLHIHVYLLNAHHCSAQFVIEHVIQQICGLAIWIIWPVYDLS